MGTEEGTWLILGCACGKSGTSKLYNVQVVFRDGTKKVYSSKPEARIGIAASGQTGTMRQVLAKDNPATG